MSSVLCDSEILAKVGVPMRSRRAVGLGVPNVPTAWYKSSVLFHNAQLRVATRGWGSRKRWADKWLIWVFADESFVDEILGEDHIGGYVPC